jgi:hypothetical protein
VNKKKRDEHFARNAKLGRTVRFAMRLDLNHVPDAERKKHGIHLGEIEIRNGTLTPRDAKRIWKIVMGPPRVKS